jgi:hypothetical protein
MGLDSMKLQVSDNRAHLGVGPAPRRGGQMTILAANGQMRRHNRFMLASPENRLFGTFQTRVLPG